MERPQKLFGYRSDSGIVYKYDGDKGNDASEVKIETCSLTGMKCGEALVLGYCNEDLIIVDKNNICYHLEF